LPFFECSHGPGTDNHQFKEDCVASACVIEVRVGPGLSVKPYVITATPMPQHVLLQYNGMTWKLPRNASRAWQHAVSFIFKAIEDHAEQQATGYDHERMDWVIDGETLCIQEDYMSITVAVGNRVVSFFEGKGWDRLRKQFSTCLMGMQYMTAAV
jgi:hypothetical protein